MACACVSGLQASRECEGTARRCQDGHLCERASRRRAKGACRSPRTEHVHVAKHDTPPHLLRSTSGLNLRPKPADGVA
eukprot:360637-Chlamydomonas_euryale.AAC.4